MTIHLCGLPGSSRRRTGDPLPAWPCSGWGLPSRSDHSLRWCALTAPFHPHLCPVARAIGGLSLLHCPSGRPDLALASILPCGVPTFLDAVKPRRGHPNDSPSLRSVRVSRTGRRRRRCSPPVSAMWWRTVSPRRRQRPQRRAPGRHVRRWMAPRMELGNRGRRSLARRR